MKDVIGERFMWIDLDTVITGNIDHIVGRNEDFVMWGDTARNTPYNGSLCLMNAGARESVWTSFQENWNKASQITRRAGLIGTDQAWIGHHLGWGEKKWGTNDGVYSFRNHFWMLNQFDLPPNTSMVVFHGSYDPSMREIQERYRWVNEHWK
jgi:hypothetical protein